jgi:hypothetical protein
MDFIFLSFLLITLYEFLTLGCVHEFLLLCSALVSTFNGLCKTAKHLEKHTFLRPQAAASGVMGKALQAGSERI